MPTKQTFESSAFSRKFWIMGGVSLLAGVLLLAACDAPSEDGSANNATENVAGNATVSANSLAENPTPKAKATPLKGAPYVLYVPNDDAMLSRQIVRDTSNVAATTYEQKAQRVVSLLFAKMEFAPKGIQLLEAPRKGKNGAVRLNFNKSFRELDTAPDTVVLMVFDALSQSLGALETKKTGPNQPASIAFLVEGKKLNEFNQFSLSDPWQASVLDETTPSSEDSDDDKSAANKTTDNKIIDNKTTDNDASETKSGGGY